MSYDNLTGLMQNKVMAKLVVSNHFSFVLFVSRSVNFVFTSFF